MLVKDKMTPRPITVTPDTPVSDALKRMRDGRFRRLPVVLGDKLRLEFPGEATDALALQIYNSAFKYSDSTKTWTNSAGNLHRNIVSRINQLEADKKAKEEQKKREARDAYWADHADEKAKLLAETGNIINSYGDRSVLTQNSVCVGCPYSCREALPDGGLQQEQENAQHKQENNKLKYEWNGQNAEDQSAQRCCRQPNSDPHNGCVFNQQKHSNAQNECCGPTKCP